MSDLPPAYEEIQDRIQDLDLEGESEVDMMEEEETAVIGAISHLVLNCSLTLFFSSA
jgi:hypothetical protein